MDHKERKYWRTIIQSYRETANSYERRYENLMAGKEHASFLRQQADKLEREVFSEDHDDGDNSGERTTGSANNGSRDGTNTPTSTTICS